LENKRYRGILPAIDNALKAKELYREDVDYIVEDNRIVIVDEITGRIAYGRVYSDGRHQAIEAKHRIKPSPDTKCNAEISLQKFFQQYDKVAGMTGTATFDKNEYKSVYGKEVIIIPSRFDSKRIDRSDVIYKTKKEALAGVITEIEEAHTREQPVLVGTLSVEVADEIAAELDKKNLKYELLHAKNHQREAEIIKNAGQRGAVTIAAKMAGRGTDIKLGERMEELGGLLVIGVERNESRRMDEQLRGRSGRRGKKGTSQFFLSF
jgi:preprotein translocase subunit SecA